MEKYQYIVVSDTNNVIEYIFASSKYKYIRGASLLLDYLNTNKAKEIQKEHNGELLSTGGGEMRVIFQREDEARKYEEAIQSMYIDETDHVTLTTALVKRNTNESMIDWLRRAEDQLRLNELTVGKKKQHLTKLHPFMKRCESCYNRAAEHEREEKYETINICSSCCKKAEHLQNVKGQVTNKHESGNGKSNDKDVNSSLVELHQTLASNKSDAKDTWIKSIEGLLDEKQNNQKIAFIYADGKGIGKLFKQLKVEVYDDDAFIEEYQKRSKSLHDALINAAHRTHKTLNEQYQQLKGDSFQHVQVDYALIGGDDLAAVLPANIATAYTYYLLKYFKEETKKVFNLESGHELAAGVIIVKKSFPIYKLFKLSYELMDRVKKQHETGMFDFQVILDSNVTSVDAKRSMSPINNNYLYGEGYSTDEGSDRSYKHLHNMICDLKAANFPGSKIKGVYHITTEQNETTLQFKWREWFAHLAGGKDKTLQTILKNWQPNILTTPFTLEEDNKRYSLLRDVFDLYEFIDKEAKIT